MKLILTKEVDGLGLPGDVVDVKDGYGRNYLVPRGYAIKWTVGGEKQIVQIKRAQDSRRIRDLSHAEEIKARIEALNVRVQAKAGEGGKLFGSVTTNQVAEAIKAAGGSLVDKRSISLPGHIKTTGTHAVEIDLHPGVVARVNLEVVGA